MNTTKTPLNIIMEQTPNPETIKFITNHLFLPSGQVLSFESQKNSDISPIVKDLFAFPFVKSILIADNYICITKQPFVPWEDILLELRDYIYEYIYSGKQVINHELIKEYLTSNENHTSKNSTSNIEDIAVKHNLPQSEIEQKIIDILNEYILPAVSQDGGFITYEAYKDGIVYLKMRGSCSGCPSSTLTLKAGIEALLKKLLPDEVKEVRSEV